MGAGSIQLARLFGIRIGASPSWFFVLFLMIYWLSGYFDSVLVGYSNTTAYAIAVAGTLLFFVSLVLHELGHAIVARRNGVGVSSIDLWFFGGLAKLTREPASPGEDFRIAAAGPAVTLVLVVLCLAAAVLCGDDGVHVLGGHGFVTDHPSEMWFRDAVTLSVFDAPEVVGDVMVSRSVFHTAPRS